MISSIKFVPPANEVCEGYVFTHVCLSTGGMRGRGVCMAGGCMAGECAWRGACMAVGASVAVGCMHGRGHVWQWGQHAWQGGMCGSGGDQHAWQGGMCGMVHGMHATPQQISQDTVNSVNEWAVRILLECILVTFILVVHESRGMPLLTGLALLAI